MSELLVSAIKPERVGAQEPFHTRHQIRLGRFQDQMKAVLHQTICVDLPTGLLAYLGQRLQKTPTVVVILKDRCPSIPAIHHVVNCPGILNSQFARHGE
jgi:hypothetical protein